MSNNFQKEKVDLQKQIDEISKRREELLADLAKTTKGISSQRETLGSEVLAGRDAGKGLDALSRESLRVDVLQSGITQADDQLRKLKQRYADTEKAAVKEAFDHVADEARDMFRICIDKLYSALDDFNALEAKFTELNRVGAPAGINSDHFDHLRLMQQMYRSLRGDFSASDGIPAKLKGMEDSFPLILAEIRAKK